MLTNSCLDFKGVNMLKKGLIFLIFFIVLLRGSLLAQSEGFIVAGEVSFKRTGDIYIMLLSEKEFNEGKESVFKIRISVGQEEIQKKKVFFKFKNVPQGVYGIKCFQDVNGNKTLDFGRFGPKEPWGGYLPKRPLFRAPKFKEVSFAVDKDITNIQVEVR